MGPASGNDLDYDVQMHTRPGTTQYWEVDFGEEIAIDGVYTHYRDDAEVHRLRHYNLTCIIYDDDGVAYTSSVFNPETDPLTDAGVGQFRVDLDTTVMGKKVRISKDVGSQTSWTQILNCREIEIRQDDGLTGENVARDAPVTVFGDEIYTHPNCDPANLTDGTIGTYCHSDSDTTDDPDEFGYNIDLDSSYSNLTHIKVYPRQGSRYVAGGDLTERLGDYVVSLYDDDGGAPAATPNWTTTRDDAFDGDLGDGDVFTALSGTGTFEGQWIQVKTTPTGLQNCNSCCVQIGEVRAFIPEPSTLVLLIGGLLAMLVRRR